MKAALAMRAASPARAGTVNALVAGRITALAPKWRMMNMKTIMVRCWGQMVPAIYDGAVRVWDSVAGAYTVCHSLTARQVARVIRLSR
jgi:hypothetical protein